MAMAAAQTCDNSSEVIGAIVVDAIEFCPMARDMAVRIRMFLIFICMWFDYLLS